MNREAYKKYYTEVYEMMDVIAAVADLDSLRIWEKDPGSDDYFELCAILTQLQYFTACFRRGLCTEAQFYAASNTALQRLFGRKWDPTQFRALQPIIDTRGPRVIRAKHELQEAAS